MVRKTATQSASEARKAQAIEGSKRQRGAAGVESVRVERGEYSVGRREEDERKGRDQWKGGNEEMKKIRQLWEGRRDAVIYCIYIKMKRKREGEK